MGNKTKLKIGNLIEDPPTHNAGTSKWRGKPEIAIPSCRIGKDIYLGTKQCKKENIPEMKWQVDSDTDLQPTLPSLQLSKSQTVSLILVSLNW